MNIDNMLKNSRPELGQTVSFAPQVRQRLRLIIWIRRMRRGLVGLAGVIMLAGLIVDHRALMEWLSLVLARPHHLVARPSTYLAALWAVAPQGSFCAATAIVLTALLSRRFETILAGARITSIKKGSAMKLLQVWPRLAIAAGAVVIAGLGVAGYSYAKTDPGKQLEVLNQTINASGHVEVTTNFTYKDCSPTDNPDLASKYQVARDSNLSQADILQVLQASCNQAAAQALAQTLFPQSETLASPALQVASYTNSSISLQRIHQDNVSPYDPLPLNADVHVYRNGTPQPLTNLKPGELVMPVMQQVSNAGPQIAALIVLPATPELKWYAFQADVMPIQPCQENTSDHCIATSTSNLYANFTLAAGQNQVLKQIQGRISAFNGDTITMTTSSGRSITLAFPAGTVAQWNREYLNFNLTLTAGDTLNVTYYENQADHSTTINASDIYAAGVAFEPLEKVDSHVSPLKKS